MLIRRGTETRFHDIKLAPLCFTHKTFLIVLISTIPYSKLLKFYKEPHQVSAMFDETHSLASQKNLVKVLRLDINYRGEKMFSSAFGLFCWNVCVRKVSSFVSLSMGVKQCGKDKFFMSANAQLSSEIFISPEQKIVLNLQTMTKRKFRENIFFFCLH